MLMNSKGLLRNMLTVKPYRPDNLVMGLAPYLDDNALNIDGFHLFSFNDVERTEAWRKEMLAEFGGGPSAETIAGVLKEEVHRA